jgi:hypothetical protein
MIFHRDLVTCNDFSDCTTRLPLQASSADGQFVAIMYGVVGGVLLRTSNQDIIDLVVDGCKRKSRIGGNECTQRCNC